MERGFSASYEAFPIPRPLEETVPCGYPDDPGPAERDLCILQPALGVQDSPTPEEITRSSQSQCFYRHEPSPHPTRSCPAQGVAGFADLRDRKGREAQGDIAGLGMAFRSLHTEEQIVFHKPLASVDGA